MTVVSVGAVNVVLLSDGVGASAERQRPSVHTPLRQVRPVKSVYDDERFVRELRRRVADHQVTASHLRQPHLRPLGQ